MSKATSDIEEQKNILLNKIKRLLWNKKIGLLLISGLLASQTGLTLPFASIFRIFSSFFNQENNSFYSTSLSIGNSINNEIRFRDVYDLFIKKLHQIIKDL